MKIYNYLNLKKYHASILITEQFRDSEVRNMKSSTLRRSNLSKEKMAVLEALSKYKQESSYDNSPNVYVRPNKEKELDLLWQNFKISQKSEKSPSVYLATGFVAGALTMLMLTTIISFSVKSNDTKVPGNAKVKNEKVNLLPADETSANATETYVVQSGDTVENIMIRFYGSFSPEKAKAVQEANNLKNLNRLQIGQELTIPME
ncbi:LysM peptidoglycan-binding domain-containing protein [bacterium]|nr:LysM peptidoglycan-binding domain-containing protein [bacterium]